ncbi:MAG: DUF2075 domain-containing protein [Actinomycetota bacterium]|nr:DUF2075 domain-containing protein [Actinomycetota bacterium]
MLAYLASKEQFLKDAPTIEDIVKAAVKKNLNLSVGQPEYNAWRNSLGNAMSHAMNDPEIPNNAAVAVEYRLNGRKFRIDFIIAGLNSAGKESVVIVELKQWAEVDFSELEDHVKTFVGGGLREETHPSYQAWSYASHLHMFNEYVYTNALEISACAYLHNCEARAVINDARYADKLAKAPVFIKGQLDDLQGLIKNKIRRGAGTELLRRVDASPIRPSKQLAEAVGSMLDGNEEFVLLDEQKTVLEKIINASTRSQVEKKQVLIIKGGPGTGKSVISINALAKLSSLRLNARYVTPNAAPRAVFESKLQDNMSSVEIKELFSGSGSYAGIKKDSFDVLIVDEAHRLKLRGQWTKGGVNQIQEIIQAARTSVFFIDEAQKVTWKDIGEISAIEEFALEAGAEIEHLELTSQFRCGGSDDYLVWLDNALGIRVETDSYFSPGKFDFKIVDSPTELHELVKEKNKINNKSRVVAGYCWEWVSRTDKNKSDIKFPEFKFEADWNLNEGGTSSFWIIRKDSVDEVGCIHTCQGLELDYVGVIIGPDLVVSDGELITDPAARAKSDKSLNGYKKALGIDPISATEKADEIIRNTYRTLMTRGMKGCYVYFTDQATADYFKQLLPS